MIAPHMPIIGVRKTMTLQRGVALFVLAICVHACMVDHNRNFVSYLFHFDNECIVIISMLTC